MSATEILTALLRAELGKEGDRKKRLRLQNQLIEQLTRLDDERSASERYVVYNTCIPMWYKSAVPSAWSISGGEFIDVNPAFCSRVLSPVGLNRESCIGRTDYDLWPEYANAYRASDWEALQNNFHIERVGGDCRISPNGGLIMKVKFLDGVLGLWLIENPISIISTN